MAKVYEALRRAEEERKRKLAGAAPSVPAVDWDPTPQTAPKPARKLSGLFKRSGIGDKRIAPGGTTASDANKRRISLLEPDSFIAEQFRMLRSRIDSLAGESPIRTIAITSANAGEGKSNVSINLAVVTAMSVGKRVLLVDCDMRRPTVYPSLGMEAPLGLAEVLMGRCSVDEAITKLEGTNLDLLGVRLQPQNPSELLGSREMRTLLDEVSERYDRVILDTPATLGLPDSKIVAGLCDGFLLVVRAGDTAREDVESALEVLDRRKALGVVLNGAELGHERYAYY